MTYFWVGVVFGALWGTINIMSLFTADSKHHDREIEDLYNQL